MNVEVHYTALTLFRAEIAYGETCPECLGELDEGWECVSCGYDALTDRFLKRIEPGVLRCHRCGFPLGAGKEKATTNPPVCPCCGSGPDYWGG